MGMRSFAFFKSGIKLHSRIKISITLFAIPKALIQKFIFSYSLHFPHDPQALHCKENNINGIKLNYCCRSRKSFSIALAFLIKLGGFLMNHYAMYEEYDGRQALPVDISRPAQIILAETMLSAIQSFARKRKLELVSYDELADDTIRAFFQQKHLFGHSEESIYYVCQQEEDANKTDN